MTSRVESEQYVGAARRWFAEYGREISCWRRSVPRDPSEPNEVLVGPKRRMQERLAGFPGITTSIEGWFSADDKVVTLLVWRGTHTGSYRAFGPVGKPGEV